ncbi:MAG TPA: 23S rRNA (guanosine(2251)-2'-O)-methyltransferase RlmB [Acidobacteriaceae bacterium]
MDVLYGLHPVEEAIRVRHGALDRVSIAREARDGRLDHLVQACRDAGIRVAMEPRDQLTRYANTDAHQGVVGFIRERKFLTIEDLLETQKPAGEYRFFLALDGVEDPHNLGALLRTADGAGVDGVLLPDRRSAPVTATVAKTSAGATEHVRLAKVTNLVRALEKLKAQNIWCIGLDERGEKTYDEFDFKADCVLVLGREGEGLHDLTRKTCDHLLRIPMAGGVSSLNVSVAGAVVMYEAARQRRSATAPAAVAAPVKAQKPRKGLGS